MSAGSVIGRTAIISGSGRLPEILADFLHHEGADPFVLVVTSDVDGWMTKHDHAIVPFTRLGGIAAALKRARAANVVMAGGVRVRPTIGAFKLDWTTLKLLPKLIVALRKGDDGLLSVAVEWLESLGLNVVGPHDLMPTLLTPSGSLTKIFPVDRDLLDMQVAKLEARRLGVADIGQAAVARNGTVIASEDRTGTAAMLKGLANVQNGFTRSGVLAKFAKPQQETRVDLPAIGLDTILQAAEAGLAGIVLEEGRSLILDREAVLAKANELGLFVTGVKG